MVQTSKNPQALMQTILQQNPNYNSVMQIVNNYGGDPKAAFYGLAKEKGVDPSSILSMMK